MASTIKVKRSATPGNAPNTSNITTGEIALNTADQIMYSSDGSTVFEIGANVTNQVVGQTLTTANLTITGMINANGSIGTSGQVLHTNGVDKVYWAADDTGAGGELRNTYVYNADEGQTVFSGVDLNGASLTISSNYVDVYINGVLIWDNANNYSTTASSVTFASGLSNNDIVTVVHQDVVNSFTGIDDNSAGVALTIDGSGNIGIGNTAPAELLTVGGTMSVTANAAFDTSTLFVDSVNNRVGIGKTNPSVELDITGQLAVSANAAFNTDTLFVDQVNDRVGVGTSSPGTTLGVEGASGVVQFRAGTASNGYLEVNAFDNSPVYVVVGGSGATAGTFGTQANIPLIFYANNSERGRFSANGNFEVDTSTLYVDASSNEVGINTSSPSANLDVVGSSEFNGTANFTGEIQLNGSAGTSSHVLKSQGSGSDPVWEEALTDAGRNATTSGTSSTITGITSATPFIDVTFEIVSSSATTDIYLSLGDSGGIETDTYLGYLRIGGTDNIFTTTGFLLATGMTAGQALVGHVIISPANGSATSYCIAGSGYISSGGGWWSVGGYTSLTTVCTQVQLSCTAGTFDGGAFRVRYL